MTQDEKDLIQMIRQSKDPAVALGIAVKIIIENISAPEQKS